MFVSSPKEGDILSIKYNNQEVKIIKIYDPEKHIFNLVFYSNKEIVISDPVEGSRDDINEIINFLELEIDIQSQKQKMKTLTSDYFNNKNLSNFFYVTSKNS